MGKWIQVLLPLLAGLSGALWVGSRFRRIERPVLLGAAQKQLFAKRPEYIQPGGNAYGEKRYNQCLRDYDWYLRLVTYGIIAGSKEPIESIGLIGVREMYNALNVPIAGMIDAIVFLKEAALSLLDPDSAAEAAPYFDYIINAMS